MSDAVAIMTGAMPRPGAATDIELSRTHHRPRRTVMKRVDEKLARIRAGQYQRQDFIIADAKDPDMGPAIPASGPKREPDGSWTRYRTRAGVPGPGPRHRGPGHRRRDADVGLQRRVPVRRGPVPRQRGQGRRSAPTTPPTSGSMRGATYSKQPSRPFRTASPAAGDVRHHDPLPRAPRSPAPTSASTRSPSTTTSTADYASLRGVQRVPRRSGGLRLQVLPRGLQPQRRHRHRSRAAAPLHQRLHRPLPRRRRQGRPAASSSRSSITAPRRSRSWPRSTPA